jgi:hypothetical protein
MQISEIRDKVSQGLLDFAWRQWAQVGVSATVEGADRWAVDPEVLFYLSGCRRPVPRPARTAAPRPARPAAPDDVTSFSGV